MAHNWKVHKFGGTSVKDASRYRSVAQIVNEWPGKKAIVVSAMKGTTDDLIETVALAKAQKDAYRVLLKRVHDRHLQETATLLKKPGQEKMAAVLSRDMTELGEILRGVWLVRNASEKITDFVSGMGEVWSAQILNAYFQEQGQKTDWLDARQVLTVNHAEGRVLVDWTRSQERLRNWLVENPMELVTISGFVAATPDGTATTLGRNGSDYSASIFGALLASDEIFIWTDVDGVLSADPRQVPEAVVLNEMSYSEVTELAYFGAKVVHPATMAPAIANGIPIWIKNSFKPTLPGTKIHAAAHSERPVKGFSTIDKICLLNIEGTGMVGIPGVAERLFAALRGAGVNVVLISQASSEHSICVAIHEAQTEAARTALATAFYAEIQLGLLHAVQVTQDVSILAAVGDAMAHSPGVAGKFFTALGRSGVNVVAIAQGSSERNISAVIDSRDSIKALRTVHSDFILLHQRISIGLIGLGLIGGTFLRQLKEQLKDLREIHKVDFQVRALADSKNMLLSEGEIALDRWQDEMKSHGQKLDLEKFSQHLRPSHLPHAVVIEATASAALAPLYKEWLASGLHIISPNKKANTGTMSEYRAIREAALNANRHFLYSTNVGAGLPILQTLRDLCATGDEIHTIQGIFSGTLSFIFNQFDGTKPFSEIVRLAKEKGFTEPDPREDLSGQDVVRKLVILAREAGIPIEISAVRVTGLVPAELAGVTADEFMRRLGELDSPMTKEMTEASAQGQVLRFVGTITRAGEARVGLERFATDHAFARVTGSDNIVLFQTKRYFHQPLVVQGPGAGPEVTAAGVFADLLRLSRYLGSHA